jgi:hypothetical protein
MSMCTRHGSLAAEEAKGKKRATGRATSNRHELSIQRGTERDETGRDGMERGNDPV